MSTSCTVTFSQRWPDDTVTDESRLYVHYDGDPQSMLPELERWLVELSGLLDDSRLDDASYLAAKYLVWKAGEYTRPSNHRLDFTGVAPVLDDVEVQHAYRVTCPRTWVKGDPLPTVEVIR